jgi:hypothetical protein
MFNTLAKIDAGRRHLVPVLARVHNNDNRPDRRLAAVSTRPPRLTCHWEFAAADGRLECHWQLEAADEGSAKAPRPGLKPSLMRRRKPAARRRLARQRVLPARNAVRRGTADGRAT